MGGCCSPPHVPTHINNKYKHATSSRTINKKCKQAQHLKEQGHCRFSEPAAQTHGTKTLDESDELSIYKQIELEEMSKITKDDVSRYMKLNWRPGTADVVGLGVHLEVKQLRVLLYN